MKNTVTAILGALFMLISASALANQQGFWVWHKVLSCDNGAVVIDNLLGYGRGGEGVMAQAVIRNQDIVRYFAQAGGQGNFIAGQWIGRSYFEPLVARQEKDPLLSFRSLQACVVYNNGGLLVVTGNANWQFHNCIRQ